MWTSEDNYWTFQVAWGDLDNDGDLDLAAADLYNAVRIYRNDLGQLSPSAVDTFPAPGGCLAWADVDSDGRLDLAVGGPSGISLYKNTNGVLDHTSIWNTTDVDRVNSIAWGDFNGDGRPDLVAASGGYLEDRPIRIYRNDSGVLTPQPVWTSPVSSRYTDVAWGDMNSDGRLDLAVSKYADGPVTQPLTVYRNDGVSGGVPAMTPVWTADSTAPATNLAWGDYDGDGKLDLAASQQQARIYHNVNGMLEVTPAWSSTDEPNGKVFWGDGDQDGDLDLLTASAPLRLYENEAGAFSSLPIWTSTETDAPESLALGDLDGDGDLDLATANRGHNRQPNRLYRNNGSPLAEQSSWSSESDNHLVGLAWGDADRDGDLDLAIANLALPSRLYRNQGGTLALDTTWEPPSTVHGTLAWGDVNNDGNLDLAIGDVHKPLGVYLNQAGTLPNAPHWSSETIQQPLALAWADYDSDGWLDLAVANGTLTTTEHTVLYHNAGGSLDPAVAWTSSEGGLFSCLAWGDMEQDGDLDLAVGAFGFNYVYENEGGSLNPEAVWRSFENEETMSIDWADVDGDGDLDLSVANRYQQHRLYRNEGGALSEKATWSSNEITGAQSSAWADVDNDGDPDLGIGSLFANRMYRNEGGTLGANAAWISHAISNGSKIAWADIDGDGDLDMTGSYGPAGGLAEIEIYANHRDHSTLPGNIPLVHVAGPGPQANGYAAAEIHSGVIPITYTLSSPTNQMVASISAWYSVNGGGQWFRAAAVAGTQTTNLTSSPAGVAHIFQWDSYASGFFGKSDNVVVRIVATPKITNRLNTTPGPFLYASYAAQSLPFRVRGTQVRVMQDGAPVAGATVYRLPAGENSISEPIQDARGVPFTTDIHGYLMGQGQIQTGDQLLALSPVESNPDYSLSYTNGTPSASGLEAYTVTAQGVQTLNVSASHPLYLYHLNVSLEWDAHQEPAYLEQLAANLQRAALYLYDFSNGQAALGQVNVYQAGDEWAYSHILVQANNHLRPYANQGGIVDEEVIDPDHAAAPDLIVYAPGQVVMGSTWNRYGNPGQSLGDDWAITLAHELSHYLFFHDDVYLGLDGQGNIFPISTCLGSAMGDLYDRPDNTEFIYDPVYWQANCSQTLAARTLGRYEWQTMQLWWPGLVVPGSLNAGPSSMPFDFTSVSIHEPYTPTNTLVDPTFYIEYTGSAASTSEARAYLIRSQQYVLNLGAPYGGQNRVVAHGAQPGDRLCVFDRPLAQFGCEEIEAGDDQLQMAMDATWNPIIRFSPVNSTTLTIEVEGLSAGLDLRARLFPDLGVGEAPIALSYSDGAYSGNYPLSAPIMSGNLQVWVNEAATESAPRRETILTYSIGGNVGATRLGGGATRLGGGATRLGGGATRLGGGATRLGGAPVVSPDGQMSFYTENPVNFAPGTYFAIQGMAGLPALPPGRTLVGQGYNLVVSPGATLPQGSVSIQYLSNDVLTAGAGEQDLGIYYYDGSDWVALNTLLDEYFNLASAPCQGAGVYALMASIQVPLATQGWNLVAYPVQGSQSLPEALESIEGAYSLVYGYDGRNDSDPWKLYAPTAPEWLNTLNTLTFGQGYWISATQVITIHFSPGMETAALPAALPAAQALQTPPAPPATYYGVLQPGNGFIPGESTVITARVNGQVCGQGQAQLQNGQWVYSVNVLAVDGPNPECGAAGRTVTFSAGQQPLGPGVPWQNERLNRLDLEARETPPPSYQVLFPLVRR